MNRWIIPILALSVFQCSETPVPLENQPATSETTSTQEAEETPAAPSGNSIRVEKGEFTMIDESPTSGDTIRKFTFRLWADNTVVNEPTESNEDGDFETNSENTESEKTKKYTVGGISATIYRDDAEDLQVHAEQALYDQKARKATMDGSVSIRSGEMTVETESVTWLNEENLLKSNSPVRIRNRNTDLTAESLQLFPKNDHMILKNCVGIIKLKD